MKVYVAYGQTADSHDIDFLGVFSWKGGAERAISDWKSEESRFGGNGVIEETDVVDPSRNKPVLE